MANEPDRWSVKLRSAKGGALAWIDYETSRGRPVTRERFLA